MSRISAFLALSLAVAACSPGDAAGQAQADAGAQSIECAIGPGAQFGPGCLVERGEAEGATVLTVRHPDGGFRRFEQLADGRGLAAFDGADPVEQELTGELLEVRVAGDRYRFPARAQQGGDAGD